MLRSQRCKYLSVFCSRASSASLNALKNLLRVSWAMVGDTQNVITNSPCASLRSPFASAIGISGSRRFAASTSSSRSATRRSPGPPVCTVLMCSLGSTSPKVFRVVKWLPAISPIPTGTPELIESLDLGVWPHKYGVTPHAVEIRHHPAHAGTCVTGTAPLAGRVGDLLSLDEGKILWTLAILIAVMGGNRVHHLSEHVRLKTLILEVSFLQRYPFMQAGKVWHYIDRSQSIAWCGHESIISFPLTFIRNIPKPPVR